MLLQMVKFRSFSWLSSSYHIFIHSSVDGPLGCFHILAIVNDAAVNVGVHVSFRISVFDFFPDIYPGVEFLGHMVVLFLVFLGEPPDYFPQWLHQFTFPPAVYKISLFSRSSLTFGICRLFDDGHSDRCEVIFHCGFDLHFSNH